MSAKTRPTSFAAGNRDRNAVKDQLKAIPPQEVAGRLGRYDPRRKRAWCPICHPNCDGKTPDVGFDGPKIKCHKCGTGWDVIGFVQRCAGLEFTAALLWLAKEFRPDVVTVLESQPKRTRQPLHPAEMPSHPPDKPHNRPRYRTADEAIRSYGDWLAKEEGNGAAIEDIIKTPAGDGSWCVDVRFQFNDDGIKDQKRTFCFDRDGWVCGKASNPPGKYPLIGLSSIRPEELVLMVEGAKDCNTANACGLPAVTTSSGISLGDCELDPLRVATEVILTSDRDKAGADKVQKHAELLKKARIPFSFWTPPVLNNGADLSDYIDEAFGNFDPLHIGTEVTKVIAARKSTTPPDFGSGLLQYRTASEVEIEEWRWVWKNVLPMGAVVAFEGQPNCGKTFMMLYMAAVISTGGKWFTDVPCEAGNVIYLTGEDDIQRTLKPRFVAMGGVPERLHFMDRVEAYDASGQLVDREFNLKDDIDKLRHDIIAHGVRLVVIDPMNAFFSAAGAKVDNKGVREVLTLVKRTLEGLDCCIAIVHHPRKSAGPNPIEAMSGVMDFAAFLRMSWHFRKPDGDAEPTAMVMGKHNIIKPEDVFGIRFKTVDNQVHLVDLVDYNAAHASERELEWKASGGTKASEAEQWLEQQLQHGGRDAEWLVENAPCGKRTLETVKKKLGIVSVKNNARKWSWAFPKHVVDDDGVKKLKGQD